MATPKNIKIFREEGGEPLTLPLEEEDNCLSLAVLKTHFPNATGLRYYNENFTIQEVKISQGKLHPPSKGWGSATYYCTYVQENECADIGFMVKSEYDDVKDKDQVSDELELEEECIEIEYSSDGCTGPSAPIRKQGRHKKNEPSARRPHRCDICGNCFTQQSHMLRHRRIHTGEKPFACDQCSERFSRSDKLKLHYDKCHSSPGRMMDMPQPEAPYTRDRREKKPKVLDSEYEWGIRPSSDKTKHLTVKFKKNAKLDLDNGLDGFYSVVNMAEVEMEDDEPEIKKEIQQVDQRKFKCTICCKPFAKKNQLQRHIRIHTGERPFKCQVCDKSFTRIDALKRHTASVGHQKQKGNTFVSSDLTEEELLGHESENSMDNFHDAESNGMDETDPLAGVGTEPDDVEDETCVDVASFAQVTYANLENINVKPEENEPSRSGRRKSKDTFCYQCNHLFTNRFNYERHMQSHGREEKSYQCTYCNYIFRRQSHLTRHILIHTGEKPFPCTQCDERFSRSDKLKLHVKRTHTGGSSNAAKTQIKIEQS